MDWATQLTRLQRADSLQTDALSTVARRLVSALPPRPTVVDVGSGAGGMSAALAEALSRHGGGDLVLVDAVPELLAAATAAARDRGDSRVPVRPVLADLAADALTDLRGAANLVWASRVVHHLPDQRQGLAALVALLAPGGRLALAEGGLETRCLPWDVGVGAPGLQDRLLTARSRGFARMRADMTGSVRLPVGWGIALAEAGLADVSAFSYLVDHLAPLSAPARAAVVDWLGSFVDAPDDLDADDAAALDRLLDPTDDAYVGSRDDVFVLQAHTVHLGTAAAAS